MKWNLFNGKRRTIEAVTADYNRACLQLGHLVHERWAIEAQERQIHVAMKAMGAEAKVLQERESKSKPPPTLKAVPKG